MKDDISLPLHRHRGHIINFSSMGGLATVSGVTLYAASKFAVRGFSSACSKDLADSNIAVTCFMPDAVQTPMVDLQLNFDEASMAFSGDILSLEEVEDCILNKVLIERPVEQWLSSRANVARFGDIFGASRAVALAEWFMRGKGAQRQRFLIQESRGKVATDSRASLNFGVSSAWFTESNKTEKFDEMDSLRPAHLYLHGSLLAVIH